MSTCPHCDVPPPACPICGALMVNGDRYMSPRMEDTKPRILSHRWYCSQGDGAGISHFVELRYPHKETIS